MTATLYGDLLAAGVQMDSHESDLYFQDTPESLAILRKYPDSAQIAEPFTKLDGSRWWEVPFAFLPWWERRTQAAEMRTGNFAMPVVDVLEPGDLKD